MTPWRDPDEVERHGIDAQTAEGLLAGRLAPDDAPPELVALARLTRAAHAPASPSELEGHDAAVAAMVAAASAEIDLRPGSRTGAALRRAASAPRVGVLVVGFGAAMAAAATGALRGPEPDVVVLEDVATTVASSTLVDATPSAPVVTGTPTTAHDGTPTSEVPAVDPPVSTEPPAAAPSPDAGSLGAEGPSSSIGTPPGRSPSTTVASPVPTTTVAPKPSSGAATGPPAVTRGMCVAYEHRAEPSERSAAAVSLAEAAARAGVTIEELCAPLLQKGQQNEPRGRR